ncbi:PREDICTED: ELMO domain-containing protein C [Ipomoea nil]|uniref:ELMO domain-containing protein C n=1 Tax=Ipomoea nil TaxID=35883 RepID=UPI000900E3A3|nr:PREDICTED: ELMO domain-containing protein C [Ipomoea nil]XP_019186796.1 PREDICTED: ELMO domain-containing protein C [Ipomoea nil]
MSSTTLRRRLHHRDLDGKRNERYEVNPSRSSDDDLDEPLLGPYKRYDNSEGCTLAEILDEGRAQERLHWTLLFSHLIAQWAQWLANIVLGSGSFIGRFLPFLPLLTQSGSTTKLLPPTLNPLQEARLKHLKLRVAVPFDGSSVQHQDALKQLWMLAYPNREFPSLKSELWKDMGWQGCDPSTDFRGGGYVSLENLIFFAKEYPKSFQNLLNKRNGKRSEWEYPFAVAGINISFMLAQMLDLQSGKPSTPAAIHFLDLLNEDDRAFDDLFCIAFEMLDAQWLAKRASYMQFNDVLKSTRTQLERELALEDISSVKDLPAYNLLAR